ncbi:glycosyltransferase family 25 protein [Pseudoalteromonas peptidolytica]|uniref:glycosyltransferase family 25 protein n=1 Tax=Pseudoalteromonas peptidolytica TaxID=61150 RepID=UPI00298E1AB1|nr:glycosyltransferase family 25 protein [Pseudoalteromonas peptidolytica]MDW7548648.1 glycosyltransferase family 25 protein [Pseudoalteromonas peptidolytica]
MTDLNIFLINLDSSKDRLKESARQFDKFNLSFERISAVDGASISNQELETHYSREKNARQYYRALTVGEIGCYMSHLKVLEEIVARQLPYAFVFEDDFQLQADLREIDSKVSALPFDWDMIKLYQSQKNRRTAFATHQIDSDLSLVIPNKVPAGTVAQLISFEGAKKILAHARPFGRPIDIDYQHFWEKQVSVLLAFPCPVNHGEIFDSTVGREFLSRNEKGNFWLKQRLQINKFFNNKSNRKLIQKQYQPYF